VILVLQLVFFVGQILIHIRVVGGGGRGRRPGGAVITHFGRTTMWKVLQMRSWEK
jgi:hypothetical protein